MGWRPQQGAGRSLSCFREEGTLVLVIGAAVTVAGLGPTAGSNTESLMGSELSWSFEQLKAFC